MNPNTTIKIPFPNKKKTRSESHTQTNTRRKTQQTTYKQHTHTHTHICITLHLEYTGYEVGGGIAGLLGFVISCIIGGGQIADKLDPNLSISTAALLSQIVTWITFIVFFTFVLFIIGCLCELELRKNDFLSPLGVTMEASEWIPVSEIVGWYYNSIGFDYNSEKEKPEGCCEKFAFAWFKIIMGVVVFVAKLIKQLFIIVVINAAFGVWIVVTFAMAFAYWAYLNKVKCLCCLVLLVIGLFLFSRFVWYWMQLIL